mgnify:FL=1
MDLFEHDPDFNLLPYDGEVNYFGVILSPSESTHYLDHLLNAIEWKKFEAGVI